MDSISSPDLPCLITRGQYIYISMVIGMSMVILANFGG